MGGPIHAQSFNADGPTVTAFETTSFTEDGVPAFGVAVFASQCGVNGVAFSNYADQPGNPHLIAPSLVGVHGKGENEGVQGEGPIGVHGISAVGGTGVLGESDRIGVSGKGDVGVWAEGGQVGVRAGATVGVEARGSLMGLHGFSEDCRAGVFQTGGTRLPDMLAAKGQPSAQIYLVPVQVSGLAERHLPKNGLAGDLLAVVGHIHNPVSGHRGEAAAELWFCVASAEGGKGARWGRVQFDTVVST